MKRIVSILIAICLLVSLTTITANAETQVYEGTGSSTMTYREYSSYCILIPEYIDAETGYYTFQAEYLNITDYEKVFVTVTNLDENNLLLFTHESGNYTLKTKLEVYETNYGTGMPSGMPENCVGYFSGEDTVSKVMFGVGFDNYECERARAGLYSATVEFAVNLGT